MTMIDAYVSNTERVAGPDAVSRRSMQEIRSREENMAKAFSLGPMGKCLLGPFSRIDATASERCSSPRSHNSRLQWIHLREACVYSRIRSRASIVTMSDSVRVFYFIMRRNELT